MMNHGRVERQAGSRRSDMEGGYLAKSFECRVIYLDVIISVVIQLNIDQVRGGIMEVCKREKGKRRECNRSSTSISHCRPSAPHVSESVGT